MAFPFSLHCVFINQKLKCGLKRVADRFFVLFKSENGGFEA